MKKSIANILFREGYIDAFEEIEEKMISKLGLGRLSVSVFGRNLFYFYKALKNYDAESSVGTSWANASRH